MKRDPGVNGDEGFPRFRDHQNCRTMTNLVLSQLSTAGGVGVTVKGGVRPTTARAAVESDVVKVSVEDFLLFLEQRREALAVLLYTVCIRLTDAERRVVSYPGASAHVGHLLLQLASTRGQPVPGEQGDQRVEVTHEDLAGMAAMNRSHVAALADYLGKKHG